MACTWKTLQLFLPKGTDLRADIQLEMIRFHVKDTEVVGKVSVLVWREGDRDLRHGWRRVENANVCMWKGGEGGGVRR